MFKASATMNMPLLMELRILVPEMSAPTETAGLLKRRQHHRLFRYVPLIIWAVLIFIGSSNLLSGSNTSMFLARPLHWLFPRAGGETLRAIHVIIRKGGHLAEYAVLALLAARAFRTSSRQLLRNHWFWASLLFVIVYSLTDEFHQSFVHSRTASIYDSMIDSLGGFLALTVLWWWRRTPDNPKPANGFRADAVV